MRALVAPCHLVSDCEVKSRTLAPSVWQPTPSALNLVVPVLRDRCSSVSLYVGWAVCLNCNKDYYYYGLQVRRLLTIWRIATSAAVVEPRCVLVRDSERRRGVREAGQRYCSITNRPIDSTDVICSSGMETFGKLLLPLTWYCWRGDRLTRAACEWLVDEAS